MEAFGVERWLAFGELGVPGLNPNTLHVQWLSFCFLHVAGWAESMSLWEPSLYPDCGGRVRDFQGLGRSFQTFLYLQFSSQLPPASP